MKNTLTTIAVAVSVIQTFASAAEELRGEPPRSGVHLRVGSSVRVLPHGTAVHDRGTGRGHGCRSCGSTRHKRPLRRCERVAAQSRERQADSASSGGTMTAGPRGVIYDALTHRSRAGLSENRGAGYFTDPGGRLP